MYSKTYEQLSKDELYALMTLRQKVFVVEQQSIYLDLDNLDQQAKHYLDFDHEGELQRYARYRYIDADQEVKIERVVLAKKARGQGLGKSLMRAILKDIQSEYPNAKISLSSQVDAQTFYQELGFAEFGEAYDDGGIMHVGMYYQQGD